MLGVAGDLNVHRRCAKLSHHFAGKPEPLGPSKQGNAINFALYAKFAKSVTLVLFDQDNRFVSELPVPNKTGARVS